jgi:hypothetical protein
VNEAEVILSRLESKSRSYRGAFCLAIGGLATLVAANAKWGAQDLIQCKGLAAVSDGSVVSSLGVYNGKIVFGVEKGTLSTVSMGEGVNQAGVVSISGSQAKEVVRIATTKGGGGSLSINSPTGSEVGNASPNVNSDGSLFIDNVAGKLVGEINGDKSSNGAIVVHDSMGKETARVH